MGEGVGVYGRHSFNIAYLTIKIFLSISKIDLPKS